MRLFITYTDWVTPFLINKVGKGIYWEYDFEVIKELMQSAIIEPKDIELVGYADGLRH